MGGVNCNNPPPGGIDISPDLKEEYTQRLAVYCKSLFTGTSQYYDAHAQIEQAVLADGSLEPAATLLTQSVGAFTAAHEQLGTVASLWQAMSGPPVDFAAQLEQLATVYRAVDDALLEVSLVPSDDALQEALWKQDPLTEACIAAGRAISAAMEWQFTFARVRAPQGAVA